MDTATTSPQSDAELIAAYFTCWNTTDRAQRAEAIEAVWAVGARSVDPLTDVTGHDQLDAMFTGFHELYPGHTFRQVGGADRHHQLLRWGWELLAADSSRVLDGLDIARIDDDGRISNLAGFFGRDLPEAP